MKQRHTKSGQQKLKDRHGKVWTLTKVNIREAEDHDFRFWFERLTPEQRVNEVHEALLSSLKTRGINAIPRFRRVHRRVKRAWS